MTKAKTFTRKEVMKKTGLSLNGLIWRGRSMDPPILGKKVWDSENSFHLEFTADEVRRLQERGEVLANRSR